MRKGRNGEKKTGGKKEKRRMKIEATMSLPAVDRPNGNRPNGDRPNGARLCQLVIYLSQIIIGWVGELRNREKNRSILSNIET